MTSPPATTMTPEQQEVYDKERQEILWAAERSRTGQPVKAYGLPGRGLVALPPEIGQLTSLQTLFLGGNKLASLPPEIGLLTSLEHLDLDGNQLTSLPPEIGQLKALKELFFSNNQLTTLPPEIGQLISLEIFSLINNPLHALPDAMAACRELVRIRLVGCRLQRLPEWLRHLPKLTHLRVAGNDALHLPPEIAGPNSYNWGSPDAKQLLDFYFSRETSGERPLNEVKLLLVGRGEAGKTSISRALRGEPFDKNERETPGIEIRPWALPCPGQDAVTVHMWDFAGQEITHETHRFFLTDRSLYLIVLDGRGGQQIEEAEYWLSHVAKYGTRREGDREEHSPVIVVLNKWDTPGPYEIERRRLQREYPNIVSFVSTDCKTGTGIEKLKESIHRALADMPAVRQPWPLTYFNVRQKLAELMQPQAAAEHRHFLAWDAFRQVCAECGVQEQERQQLLAKNLNALGAALYYGHDARLRDTRVLNPNWVANGLYGIVRGVQRRPWQGQPGYLWAGEFAAVLAEGMMGMDEVRGAAIADYPVERDSVHVHEFLLDLMLDRELGFQTGEVGGQPLYLLPGQLTLDEPSPGEYDIAAHIDRAEVRFRYRYELLPAGVMSLFIVRTHELSAIQYRWQRGTVLTWGDARALVMAERRRNPRVDVYITGGTAAERQQLAGAVRSNMEEIHRQLPLGLHGAEELDLTAPGDQYESVPKLEQLEAANQPVQILTDAGPQQLPVTPQLEQVQPASARRDDAPRLRVFVSYAHANYKLWDRFKTHLDILKNESLISWWFDGEIHTGTKWDDHIRRELNEANIIVLLLSNAFFASKYILGVELQEARRRHESGASVIIPVLLEPSPALAAQTWLKTLQAVPKVEGTPRPISTFARNVTGWNHVQTALREVIAKIATTRRPETGPA